MTLVKVNNRPAVKTWNGLFNELFSDLERSLPTNGPVAGIPPVNVVETNEGYHAELLAPGRRKELFTLKVENNQLIIGYEEEKANPEVDFKQVRREFSIGNFKRSFGLDENIEADGIQAKYEDGILKIYLPKKAVLQPATHTIAVQ